MLETFRKSKKVKREKVKRFPILRQSKVAERQMNCYLVCITLVYKSHLWKAEVSKRII